MESTEINELVEQLSSQLPEHAYKISNQLAATGGEEVLNSMVALLQNPNAESRIIAARTLGRMTENEAALEALIEAVKAPENKGIAGDLLMAIDGFDVSHLYVELFRMYLFGSYKVSMIAKSQLDFREFDITPRVLRKAKKHWDHYLHNSKHDDQFEMKKQEVEAIFMDLEAFLSD